jgi:hypothetical protein
MSPAPSRRITVPPRLAGTGPDRDGVRTSIYVAVISQSAVVVDASWSSAT